MNTRFLRPLTLSAPICVTALAISATGLAETGPNLVWRLAATEIEGNAVEVRDVHLVSPTTYVVAERATVSPGRIEATHATVLVDDWSLEAERVVIDPAVDAVEITTARSGATQE